MTYVLNFLKIPAEYIKKVEKEERCSLHFHPACTSCYRADHFSFRPIIQERAFGSSNRIFTTLVSLATVPYWYVKEFDYESCLSGIAEQGGTVPSAKYASFCRKSLIMCSAFQSGRYRIKVTESIFWRFITQSCVWINPFRKGQLRLCLELYKAVMLFVDDFTIHHPPFLRKKIEDGW